MAGRPTRLRNDRAHHAKPYEKRTSVLQSMVSAVRALIPSFLSESASEPPEAAERQELSNGEREQPPWVPMESPRLMRDCAVGTDNEEDLEPVNFSLSSPPPPERPLERPPERPLERPPERPLERPPERPLERSLERPPVTPSPSSWMNLAASSHKRPKLYHEENPLQSPFYPGRTTYGGAAAQNRLRLLATSQTAASPVVVRSVKSGGAASSGLSNTTRHMLATLEKMATPVAEAKRVPLHRRVPSGGRPWSVNTPSPPLALTGPPVRSAARLTIGWAAQHRPEKSQLLALGAPDSSRVESPRVDTPRSEASRVEASRVEASRVEASRVEASRVEASRVEASRVEASRVEASRVDAPRVDAPRVDAPRVDAPRVDTSRVDASRVEASRPKVPPRAPAVQEPQQTAAPAAPKVETSRVSAPPPPPPPTLPAEQKLPSVPPWEPPPKMRAADRTSGGGKMVRVIHTACHPAPIRVGGPPAEPETELPPAVPLPPIKSLPSFSFCLKPQEPSSSAGASTTPAGSRSTPNASTAPPAEFSFSKPEPVGEASTLLQLPPKADQVFKFSEPWGPNGEEESQKKKDKANTTAPQGTPKLQDTAGAKVDSPAAAASSGLTSSAASAPKKAEDAEKKAEASEAKGSAKDGTKKDTNDLWERFKPPPGSWTCSSCMLGNPGSASRCQACEEPKPGTGAAPPAAAPAPAPRTNDLWERFKPPAGSWTCSSCMLGNPASASRCQACEEPKPGTGAAPPGAAPAPAPASAPAAAAALPSLAAVAAAQAPLWECDTCLVRNQPGAQRCCACETPRPSPANGLAASSAAATAAAAAFNFTLAPTKDTGFGGAPFSTGGAAPKQIKFGITTDGPTEPAKPSTTVEAPANAPFKFGITAGVPVKPAEPGTTVGDASKTFNFGSTSEGTSKTIKFGAATEESAKPLFQFGAAAEPPKVPGFGVVAEDPAKTVTPGPAATEPAKGVKRGATEEEQPKFPFGSPGDQPAKGFKLGGAAEAAKSPAEAPTFKFGTSQVEPAKAPPQLVPTTGDTGFKFGSDAKEPAKPFAFGSTPQQATTGFKFGSGSQEPAKQPFAFGSSEEPQPAKAFKFGAASDEPAKTFKFGAATTEPSKFGSVADTAAKSPLFTFGSPATTSTAAVAPAPFSFGMADKPSNAAAMAATEPRTVPPLAGSQDASGKQLPSLLPAPAMPASMPSSEAPKPAFSTPFVFGAKTESVPTSPSSFMFGVQQQPPATFPTPNGGAAAASLAPFGALPAKPPEPPQPTQPLFGAALATTAFSVPTLKPTVTSTVAGFGSGFAPSVPAAPSQSSFVFRPQTTAPPATFQFGSTGPTSSNVFRFGAQPSQPAPLQQPQQPASEGFGASFGQPNTMGFNAPAQPFPMMENPFNATGTGSGPSQQQRRIRKAVRRTKPNAR